MVESSKNAFIFSFETFEEGPSVKIGQAIR